jgi:hypothetical protein
MGQFHKLIIVTGLALVMLGFGSGTANAACVNPAGVTGEVLYNSSSDAFQGCTTNGWAAFNKLNRSPSTSCTHPTATPGEIVYKSAYTAFMGCTLAGWQAFNPPADPCAPANPEIGSGCLDGTIYVGKTPDGNVKMFTTSAGGVGQAWNNGNSANYVDVGGLTNCTTGAQASCNTGRLNTPIIAAADASSAGGFQTHNAATYCHNLVEHGYSDWYLPAYHELAMLYTARNEGALAGTFPTVDSFPSSLFWSSSEYSNVGAMQINFATGGGYPYSAGANVDKRWSFKARCVRNELSAVAVASGLIGYWKFDDGPGSATAVDSSGQGNTGTLTSMNTTTAWVGGKQGYALNFDGTDDRVNAGSAAGLDNMAASSGCAWTYRTESGVPTLFPTIMDKSGDANGENGWNFYLNNHFIINEGETTSWPAYYNIHGAYKERDGAIPHNGTWQHVCFTWDGDTGFAGTELYVNGVLLTSLAYAADVGGPYNDAANSLGIGGQAAGLSSQWFKGRLDNVRLYNRALSGAEVLEIYQSEGGL